MNANEIVKALETEVLCESCPHNGSDCHDDGCYYIMAAALIDKLQALAENGQSAIDTNMRLVKVVESLQAQLAKPQRLNDEPPAYKFYYCESEDSYLLGRRVDNFYYAHWHEGLGFVWDMSRYLPWGEHVVSPATAWKEHTYPSEPKEIAPGEWFSGFIAQRLAASQRRERAAEADLAKWKICGTCKHFSRKRCLLNIHGPNDGNCAGCRKWQWRGPQEAEKGETNA